jgi:hypothetical protein
MTALRKHCQDPWILLYVERWLKAPMQSGDGQLHHFLFDVLTRAGEHERDRTVAPDMYGLRLPVLARERDFAIDAPFAQQSAQHDRHHVLVAIGFLGDGRGFGDDDNFVRERGLVVTLIDERHRRRA